MLYLDSFTLPTEAAEMDYYTNFPYQLEMACYDANNVYPFKIFPPKGLTRLKFDPVTIFYGGNGSGKSTLLNVIAGKLRLSRPTPYNKTPHFDAYLERCSCRLCGGKPIPEGSRILTSDDIFDFLLDVRSLNQGVDRRREELFREYEAINDPNAPRWQMRSLDDYHELKQRNEARSRTKSAYVTRRLSMRELPGQSNGESAFACFTREIREDALYLLDEPENSLSPRLQMELLQFLEDSARFYRCQLVISTHSPFLLSMKGARIYDLDASPAAVRPWTELENVRIYYELFRRHANEF